MWFPVGEWKKEGEVGAGGEDEEEEGEAWGWALLVGICGVGVEGDQGKEKNGRTPIARYQPRMRVSA